MAPSSVAYIPVPPSSPRPSLVSLPWDKKPAQSSVRRAAAVSLSRASVREVSPDRCGAGAEQLVHAAVSAALLKDENCMWYGEGGKHGEGEGGMWPMLVVVNGCMEGLDTCIC